MRALNTLPDRDAAGAMNAINVAAIHPAFLGLFLGTAALSVILIVSAQAAGIAGGLTYLAGVLGVTMLRNVPWNNRLARLPECWPEYARIWTLWNHFRTAAAIAAACLFIAELL